MNIIGDVKGKNCILVDDIVDSGGTLCNAADALLQAGATDVRAYITHGVLSGGAVARISSSQLKELVVTDTIQPTEAMRVSRKYPRDFHRAADRRGHRAHRQGRKRLQPVQLNFSQDEIDSAMNIAANIANDLKSIIRTIPDYPKPGIMFRDITTLLGDARAFRRAVDELVQPFAGTKIDKVAGIEARGFILGGAVAHQLSAGFIPLRKKGKLPHRTRRGGVRAGIRRRTPWRCTWTRWRRRAGDAGRRPDRHRRHGAGAVKLLRKAGAEVVAAGFVIDLPDLGGAEKLRALGVPVSTLVAFEGH